MVFFLGPEWHIAAQGERDAPPEITLKLGIALLKKRPP